jgi:hypothetical protein
LRKEINSLVSVEINIGQLIVRLRGGASNHTQAQSYCNDYIFDFHSK